MSDTLPDQPDTLDIAALHAALAGVRLGQTRKPLFDPNKVF